MKKALVVGIAVLLLAGIPILRSCSEDNREQAVARSIPGVQIVRPVHGEQFTTGDSVDLQIKVNRPTISDLDLFVNDRLYRGRLPVESTTVTIPTGDFKVGKTTLYLSYKDVEGKVHRDTRTIVLFSDIVPENKGVKVVNKWAHQPSSYTQGLEFYNGSLFESTGRYGSSHLSEVHLETGQIIRKKTLSADYFGEGITILNDTIYQLTYLSQTCKVYDMAFDEIKAFNYVGEGWGLTNDGRSIIMSNGSEELVWRDPKTFQITKRLPVFDHRNSVVKLNELALVDNRIYANIYEEKKIVEIDTATGKVMSYIDCSELVSEQPLGVDYLNGIAYQAESGHYYLTGKLWPSLYQVKFE